MRSAVSAILSEPLEQSPMAFPDYDQVAADHRRALVLVSPLGSRVSNKLFQRVFDRIAKVQRITIAENNQTASTTATTLSKPRQFHTRYLSKAYPVENNDWGEFQFHRSLLGLITVGGYSTTQELSELTRLHDATKTRYANSLLDSRLVAIGVASGENGEQFANSNSDDYSDENNPPGGSSSGSSLGGDHSRVLFYQSSNFEETLEADLVDFLTHLFWVLELRRRDFLKERPESRLPFLCAPFEKKDFVGLDLESRTNRKRTFGRHRKHVADLCLLCDCLTEAQQYYDVAVDILRSCNDWIWLAGALEGLCAVSVIVLYPRIQRNSITTQRNNSYSVVTNTVSVVTNKTGSLNGNGKAYLNDEDEVMNGPKSLATSDVLEKYKEAVLHYGKYRHAGVIETEASIKAVQVMTEQKNYVLAAEFLQNIVFINLQMNDEEKIQRFSALAKLYQNIGFRRKSAFFLRVSAMRCVAPQNQHPDWNLCYQLLLKTSAGYHIDLNNTFAVQKQIGWPTLQIQVLQELVGTARRMGNHAASTHHMTFLLEFMFDHLSNSEKLEFCTQLSALTSRTGDADTPVILENGILLPPIGMYKVPRVTSFEPMPLPPHLEPKRDKNSRHHKKDSGVFFFTPIQFGGKTGDPNMMAFKWVEGDVAEVCLTLYNPLPTEIKLVNLALLHEGIEFETFPSALSLAASSGPHKVSLVGVPKGTGVLKILGYTCTVLGVRSTCKLSRIKNEKSEYTVNVLPSMPQLGAKIRRTGVGADEEESSPVQLHDGETANFELSLTNVSTRSAQKVTVICMANPPEYSPICTLSGQISKLEPGETSTVQATVRARRMASQSVPSTSSISNSCDTDSVGKAWGILSRLDPSRWSGASKKSGSSRETAIETAANKGSNGKSIPQPVTVTLNFKVIYSGGAASEMGYQRELTKTLIVEVVPSAVVTKWDVLPADKVNENYLVLDIANMSEHEMDLKYAPTKRLTIEQGDVCRIPLPVTKFEVGTAAGAPLHARQKFCSEYLEKFVQIEWTISRLERSGQVSLHDVTLDADMISSLEHCPVEWNVTLDGAGSQEFSNGWNVALGHSVALDLSLRNDFEFEIRGEFRIDCYLQGQRCSQVSDALVLMTQCESEGQTCSPGAHLSHSTSMLPLASGSFELVVTCTLEKTSSSAMTTTCHNETSFSFISKYPKINIIVNDEVKYYHRQ